MMNGVLIRSIVADYNAVPNICGVRPDPAGIAEVERRHVGLEHAKGMFRNALSRRNRA